MLELFLKIRVLHPQPLHFLLALVIEAPQGINLLALNQPVYGLCDQLHYYCIFGSILISGGISAEVAVQGSGFELWRDSKAFCFDFLILIEFLNRLLKLGVFRHGVQLVWEKLALKLAARGWYAVMAGGQSARN